MAVVCDPPVGVVLDHESMPLRFFLLVMFSIRFLGIILRVDVLFVLRDLLEE